VIATLAIKIGQPQQDEARYEAARRVRLHGTAACSQGRKVLDELGDIPASKAGAELLFDVERSLLTTSGVTAAADTPSASHPRLSGISFLHRYGSTLNHHVHLRALSE